MNPKEEEKDLVENPLPEIVTEKDKTLPSLLWKQDEQISRLEALLRDLHRERGEMISRAVKLGIMNDGQYLIDIKEVHAPRSADPELLRSRFPELYQNYVKIRIEEIKSANAVKTAREIAEVEQKIHLATADKIFGKKNVNLCSAFKVTFEYVIKKLPPVVQE
jgi:hypothetical protein